MRARAIAGLTSSMLAASLVLSPGWALGEGRDRRDGDDDRRPHQRPSVTVRPGPAPAQPPSLQTRVHVPRSHHGHVPRVYGWPTIYDDPGYAPSPLYAPPASTMSITSSTPSVVEYPNGRYELRGDGVWSAYRWVWIPNPPSAPPVEAAPPAEPAPEPATAAAPSVTAPAPRTDLYRWTDEHGTVHWTDRWDAVPEAYRAKATKLKS